jgi:L-ascorbate metabolism protein UlaG (beta-lactamase superfamily)
MQTSSGDSPTPPSGHFDGRRFHNDPDTTETGFFDMVRWRRTARPAPWRRWTDVDTMPDPPAAVEGDALRVTFVNHATVLVQMAEGNVLTDPIWSDRASPVPFAGPERHMPPGIAYDRLPPIHVVVVSHNHFDHMDVRTLRRLESDHSPLFVTSLRCGRVLRRAGCRKVVELDWWELARGPSGMRIHAVPARHFSTRAGSDRNVALWMGAVVEGRSGRTYFAGDTGYGPHFASIRERMGPPRLAILPIGAFRPEWFMGPVHISPDEAVRALLDLEAKTGMAMHFGTFRLADDGQDEPVRRLRQAIRREGMDLKRFWIPGQGEGRNV